MPVNPHSPTAGHLGRFSFYCQHKQRRNDTLLCASWSTRASNSPDQRKVELLSQWAVFFLTQPCPSLSYFLQPPPTAGSTMTSGPIGLTFQRGLSKDLFPKQSHSGAGICPPSCFLPQAPESSQFRKEDLGPVFQEDS